MVSFKRQEMLVSSALKHGGVHAAVIEGLRVLLEDAQGIVEYEHDERYLKVVQTYKEALRALGQEVE